MDQSTTLAIVQKYAAIIRSVYDVEDILLFGSYAKGNAKNESDIDIAVIFNDFDNLSDTQVRLMMLTRHIDSRIEPHPIRQRDFNPSNPLAAEILNHGICL